MNGLPYRFSLENLCVHPVYTITRVWCAYLVASASHVSLVRGNWNSCGTDHWLPMIRSRDRDKNRRRDDVACNKRESVRGIYRFCAIRRGMMITGRAGYFRVCYYLQRTTRALRILPSIPRRQNYSNCDIVDLAR